MIESESLSKRIFFTKVMLKISQIKKNNDWFYVKANNWMYKIKDLNREK